MAIVIPSCPLPNDFKPFLRDFGGILTPFLGGPEQRINRVGTRFGLRVSMPPMDMNGEGRIFVARLLQARESRALLPWPMLTFNPGTPGSPLVATAATGGSVLDIKGLTAAYPIKEGQFFSIIHGGRRYVHMFTADVTAAGGGTATTLIYPMLRTSISVNDVIEIAAPIIEGHVLPGDELGWQIGLSNQTDIAFSIAEAA